MPIDYSHDHDNEITLFGEVNFRNQRRRFGIKTDDRRRHMYVIGKTGMGKTTLLENLIAQDINAGHGCCYIDPHGDTAEKIIDYIPANRINDVVYFNPADAEFPMGFNILELDNEEQKPLVASGLMGVFKKIWPDVWSPRMEYILMNCVLALLDYPGATLMGINRLLVDKEYRARVIAKIRDPIVKTFWVAEFAAWSEKYATEAIAPVQNKVGQFLSSSVIRNIVAQVKSTMNLRRIMDDGKILIVNLSKGRIGEDNMRLLGGMLITKLQLAAQERQNMKELDRRDFYMYVDEFQNFANESFASILSEARKYRLNLIVAHQYIEQLDEKVAPAIFGNVGTLIVMRVGAKDAEFMETEFAPSLTPEDLVSLAKFQMYMKLMVDGVATAPFSANSMPPIAQKTQSTEKVIKVSRERYAEPRQIIEEKVLKWAGMELQLPGAAIPNPPTPSSTVVAVSDAETPVAHEYPLIQTEEEKEQLEQVAAKSPVQKVEPVGTETEPTEYLKIRPERMAAIQATVDKALSSAGQKKQKPKFTYSCSRCGKQFELAVQLDTSRPIYCTECRPIILEERKKSGTSMQELKKAPIPPERAARMEPRPPQKPAQKPPSSGAHPEPNRPRIVRETPPQAAIKIVSAANDQEKERESLLAELTKTKGSPIETDKRVLESKAGQPRRDERGRRRPDRPRESRAPESSKPAPTVSAQPISPAAPLPPSPTPPPPPPTRMPVDADIVVMPSMEETPDTTSGSGHTLRPGQKISF